jgi:hypothetical protein
MLHNRTASTVNLAKSMLMDLNDQHTDTVTVATATLRLLLATLIEIGTADNPIANRIEAAQAAFVASRINGLEGR